METSITSEMVLQQSICGDTEGLNIKTTNDMEYNLTQSNKKMEIEQTKDDLK